MKYNIHVTQAAERDMANAYDYIDLVLKNPTAADKLLDVADEKIGALAEFPHKFEVVADKLLSLWGMMLTSVRARRASSRWKAQKFSFSVTRKSRWLRMSTARGAASTSAVCRTAL